LSITFLLFLKEISQKKLIFTTQNSTTSTLFQTIIQTSSIVIARSADKVPFQNTIFLRIFNMS